MSTLKVDTILKRTGTGTITLGQSGDTISLPTGASLSLQGGTNGQALTTNGSGTLSFATVGEDNSPYFLVNGSGTQTISNSADTVLAFNQVISSMDSASGYNTSNYRYTVQTGGAGLWYVRAGIYFSSASSFGNGEQVQMQLRVNGGAQLNNHMFFFHRYQMLDS